MSRALYLSDNEFEHLSPEIKNMKNLRILALRDNELVDIPQVGSASGLVWLVMFDNASLELTVRECRYYQLWLSLVC